MASLGPSNQAAPGWLLLHDLYYPWVYLAVFYGLLTLLNRHCWPTNWHFTWHFPPRVAWGIAGSLAVIWGLAVWLLTPGHFIAAPAFNFFEFARTLAGFITAVLVTPLIEELAFRKVILARLSANYGARVGLWGSALLFGASHLLNGRFQWQSALLILLAGTAIGLLLALVRATTGTLWASYLVHATFNGLTSLLMAQASPANDWPWTYLLTSHSLLLTGGEYGINTALASLVAYLLTAELVFSRAKRHGWTLAQAELTRIQ